MQSYYKGYYIVKPPAKFGSRNKSGQDTDDDSSTKANVTNDNFFRALQRLTEEAEDLYEETTPIADHITKVHLSHLKIDPRVIQVKPSDKALATWTYVAGSYRLCQLRKQEDEELRSNSLTSRLGLPGHHDSWELESNEPYQCLGFRFEDWFRGLTVMRCWAANAAKNSKSTVKRKSPNVAVFPPEYFTLKERKKFKRHQQLAAPDEEAEDVVDGLGDYIANTMPARARFLDAAKVTLLGHDDAQIWLGANTDAIGKALLDDLTQAEDPNAQIRPPFATKRQLREKLQRLAWRTIVPWGPAEIDAMRATLKDTLANKTLAALGAAQAQKRNSVAPDGDDSGDAAGEVDAPKDPVSEVEDSEFEDSEFEDSEADDSDGDNPEDPADVDVVGLSKANIVLKEVSAPMPSYSEACNMLDIDPDTRQNPLCSPGAGAFKVHQIPGNVPSLFVTSPHSELDGNSRQRLLMPLLHFIPR